MADCENSICCLCLWWDVYKTTKAAKGQRVDDTELVVVGKGNTLAQVSRCREL